MLCSCCEARLNAGSVRSGWLGSTSRRGFVSKSPENFQEVLGLELVEASGDRVVYTCTVRGDLHQPYGILHGGVHCSIVESAASLAGAIWLGDSGQVVGVNNSTNFIRAVSEGTLTATATPLQRGRTQQLWQVAIVDDQDRLVAHGQVRLANLRHEDRSGQPASQ
jgi:uncharacterized protein (TIGR00369 family)